MQIPKINLWSIKNEKVKIKIKKQIRNSFFFEAQKIFRTNKQIINFLRITNERFYRFKSGKASISMIFIVKIIDKFPKKLKLYYQRKIESNLTEIKFGNNPKSKPIKNPKFPILFSSKLARIAAHIIGDGGMQRSPTDLTVYYANKNGKLIDQFKNDILDTLGTVEFKDYTYKGTAILILPSIVGIILTKFFGEQQNETKHIPKIIFKSDKKMKAVFLGSLYDDEGSVSISSKCILFKMISENVVKDCRNMLKEFSIRPGNLKFADNAHSSSKRIYYFYLSGKPDLEKFKKYFTLFHSDKSNQLNKILANYKTAGFKWHEAV